MPRRLGNGAYRTAHEEWGFVVGNSSPCVMYHPEKGIRLVVHGDDFTPVGIDVNLDWHRNQLMSRFEAKAKE